MVKKELHFFLLIAALSGLLVHTVVKGWHIVLQCPKCVGLQHICGVDCDESSLEAGNILQEETIPRRVGESHDGRPHSEAPTHFLEHHLTMD